MQENGASHFLLKGRFGAAQPQPGFRHDRQSPTPSWSLLVLIQPGKTSFQFERGHSVATLASSIYVHNISLSTPPPNQGSPTHDSPAYDLQESPRGILHQWHHPGHSPPRQLHRRPTAYTCSTLRSVPYPTSSALGKPPPSVFVPSRNGIQWPCWGLRGCGFCELNEACTCVPHKWFTVIRENSMDRMPLPDEE